MFVIKSICPERVNKTEKAEIQQRKSFIKNNLKKKRHKKTNKSTKQVILLYSIFLYTNK